MYKPRPRYTAPERQRKFELIWRLAQINPDRYKPTKLKYYPLDKLEVMATFGRLYPQVYRY